MLEVIDVGIRVTVKASLKNATETALLKTLTLFTPSLKVARDQVLRRRWHQEGQHAGDEVHCPTQHQGGRGLLLAADPPFVVTYRAEELFEVVVGARQAFDFITVEQAGQGAIADLEASVRVRP